MSKEEEFIDILRGFVEKPGVGLFDDAALIRIGGELVVLSVDMVAESTDLLPGMSYSDLAWKSVASSVSDVSVKGGEPRYMLSSIGLPGDVDRSLVESVRDGLRDASKEYGLELVAGDLGSCKEVVIDLVVVGRARRFVSRSGARAGDVVCIAGWGIGYNWLGYKMLLEGRREISSRLSKKVIKDILSHLYRPRVPVGFNIRASMLATSSIDSSDGVAASLNELSRRSSVRIVLEKLPAYEELEQLLRDLGVGLVEPTLYGGEEYCFVGTVPPDGEDQLELIARETKTPFFKVGRVEEGEGVYLRTGGSMVRIGDRGWTHF